MQEKYELIIINQNVIIYMNEATELLKRIFSEEKNTVHYCGEADLVEKLSDALYNGDIFDFESPDIYMHIAAYVGRFCGAKRPRCIASDHSF